MTPLTKPFCSALFFAFLLTANANTLRGIQQRSLDPVEKVDLGTAGGYAILAKSGISTVPSSNITGDIAVSPIAGAAMTGFSFSSVDDGKASTSTQVKGNAYAADYISPTPSQLTTAVSDMETAYTNAAGRTNHNAAKINLGGGAIGGKNLTSVPLGIYTFQSDVTINDDVTFNGDSDAIFIIQMTGNLEVAANKKVILRGGVKAENIFWQIAGHVVVMLGAHMEGILLVKTDVTFVTQSYLNGRILAQTAVNLQMATIVEPVELDSSMVP